jgi:F-type H+-transporting ATPase subunit delta
VASSTRQSRLVAEQELSKLGKVGLLTTSELFAATNALLSSPQLRSALSDPSAQAAGKSKLVEAVFGPKFSKETVGLLGKMAQMRWSATRDLALTAEALGVRAAAAASQDIDTVQAELFAVGQLVSSDPQLELALSSTRASVEAKMALVAKLLNNKATETTGILAGQAVHSRTFKRFAEVLEQYGMWIAEFAGESVANIRASKELSEEQLTRLSAALTKVFGRELQLNVEIDQEIIGGLHITVNGEVLDATVLTKLQNARLQLG